MSWFNKFNKAFKNDSPKKPPSIEGIQNRFKALGEKTVQKEKDTKERTAFLKRMEALNGKTIYQQRDEFNANRRARMNADSDSDDIKLPSIRGSDSSNRHLKKGSKYASAGGYPPKSDRFSSMDPRGEKRSSEQSMGSSGGGHQHSGGCCSGHGGAYKSLYFVQLPIPYK